MVMLTDFILMNALLIGLLAMLIGGLNLLLIVAEKAFDRGVRAYRNTRDALTWRRIVENRIKRHLKERTQP